MSVGIRFSQMVKPPLEAGAYEILVEQVTNLKVNLASEMMDITVATERFEIPQDQVYSVYPPAGAVGDYSNCLPHIVLKRRTMPWEMKLSQTVPNMPWMALLVFDETESFSKTTATCQEALTPEVNTFVPSLKLFNHEKADSPCTYITLLAQDFKDLMPYEDELGLLAHGKGVSLDYKVTDATVKDDWFATVVTNRFCLMPTDETHALTHTACLVALEGFEALLKDPTQRHEALKNFKQVRMIVLSSWQFSMAKPLFDFDSVFTNMDTGMLKTPYQGDQPKVRALCDLGYYPMNHQMRDGSQTVSWYQSPLIPYHEAEHSVECVQFSDRLLCYDPEISMFDVRYASAWQLGKSMALADQGFAQKLFDWRLKNQNIVKTALYHQALLNHLYEEERERLLHTDLRQEVQTTLSQTLERALMEVLENDNPT